MVRLLREEAIEIDTRKFIEKYGINGLSGFKCYYDKFNGNVLDLNPSLVKGLMEHGWDPTICMMHDGDDSDFFSFSTRFELYTSIYMASSYPKLNRQFIRYFRFQRDFCRDGSLVRMHWKNGEEYKIFEVVDRFKNKMGFEFLLDPEDPEFRAREWMNVNPTVKIAVKIQSFVRMILCIKKVQLMRYHPDALFDKNFGNMRRNLLEVKESNWNRIYLKKF